MYVPAVQLHHAPDLDQASRLMQQHAPEARLLAGGTDLLVDLKTRRVRVGHLVSLNRIDALRGVSEDRRHLRVGALTTITDLNRSPIVGGRFAPLRDATSRMAAPQIRNAATVGGNIASAVPCADLPPILAAMNAVVVLWSPGSPREVAIEKLFVGARATVIEPSEVLTSVLVPAPEAGFGAAYARFALRDGNAIAVAAVASAVTLDASGGIRDARVVLGAVAPIPKRVASAEAVLVGQRPDEEVFIRAAALARDAAEPISDVRGSADFRRHLVTVLTRRALAAASRRAREAQP